MLFNSTLDAALSYAERGWPIFPVKANKQPYTDNGFHAATTDPGTIVAWWRRWPDAQVAVACGAAKLAVVDLDIGKGKDGIQAFARLKDDHGPDWCSLVATTPRGGRHMVYRMPAEPITCRVDIVAGTGIDVRGEGGYIVLPSPNSPGREWVIGDAFDDEDLVAVPEWVERLIRGRSYTPSPGVNGGTVFPLTPTQQADIREALKFISPEGRDEWIRIGMALKSTGAGEQAYEIWVEWSQQSTKYDPRVQRRQWDSLREFRLNGTEITLGSLFHMARENGYVSTGFSDLPSMPEPESSNDERLSSDLQGDQDIEMHRKLPFPTELLNCPGLVGDVADLILKRSYRRQPALALGAAIATMGAVLGRRVRTPNNVRTNVYALGIAPTGGGKDSSLKVPAMLLQAARLATFVGPGEWKSDSGLRAALMENPSHCCYVDEMVKLLAQMNDQRAPAHLRGIRRQLLEAYSSSDGVLAPPAYADRVANRPVPLEQPNLCVFGTGVPEEIFGVLGRDALADGLLNRFLVFWFDDGLPRPQRTANGEIPGSLLQRLVTLHDRLSESQGLLANRGEARVEQIEIGMTDEATLLLEQIGLNTDDEVRRRRKAGDPCADLWTRTSLAVAKLALIRAASDELGRMIDVEDIRWAHAVVGWSLGRTAAEAAARMTESATEGNVKRVLRIIDEAGAGGISRSRLCRLTQFLKGHDRKDVLATLVESGQVVVREVKVGGSHKPTAVLVSAKALAW